MNNGMEMKMEVVIVIFELFDEKKALLIVTSHYKKEKEILNAIFRNYNWNNEKVEVEKVLLSFASLLICRNFS